MGNGYRVQGLGYRLCSNAAVHVGSIYGVRVLGGRLVVAQAQCSHACNLWAAILTEVHASLDSGHPLPWHLTPFTLAPHSFYPGTSLLLPWHLTPFTLAPHSFYPGTSLLLPWHITPFTLSHHSFYPGTSLLLPWHIIPFTLAHTLAPHSFYPGASLFLPWHLTPFTLAPHSFYPGTSLILPCTSPLPPHACSNGWPCSPLPCP